MRKYLAKRLIYLVIVFFVVSLMMYAIYNLIPSDPALVQMEPLRKTLKPDEWTAQYLELRTKLGLDQPLLVRYARWMGFMREVDGTYSGLLQGNFGYSVSYKRPVIDIIGTPMLNTIMLNFFSTIITLAITIPLGIYCAVHARSAGDSVIQAGTVVGYSLPLYLVGILFIYIFAVLLRWLPTGGAKTPGSTYVGMREFADRLYYMALPVLVLVFAGLAGMTRTVRAAMIDTLSQDYIRTARAKGLREKTVLRFRLVKARSAGLGPVVAEIGRNAVEFPASVGVCKEREVRTARIAAAGRERCVYRTVPLAFLRIERLDVAGFDRLGRGLPFIDRDGSVFVYADETLFFRVVGVKNGVLGVGRHRFDICNLDLYGACDFRFEDDLRIGNALQGAGEPVARVEVYHIGESGDGRNRSRSKKDFTHIANSLRS